MFAWRQGKISRGSVTKRVLVDVPIQSHVVGVLVIRCWQMDCTAFGSLLHAMEPQQLKDVMPMLGMWCVVSNSPTSPRHPDSAVSRLREI